MGRGPGIVPGEKAKDFKGSILKFIGYLGKYKWTILFAFALAIASTVFTVSGPKILGQATDDLFTGIMNKIAGTGSVDFGEIGGIILLLIGLYGVSAVLSYLQGFVMANVTAKVTFKMRNDILDKMNKLPFGYYDKTTHGDILSRITNDVDTISQSLNQSLTQIITSVTSVLGIALMMFSINWQLTLVTVCVIPVSMIFVTVIVTKYPRNTLRISKIFWEASTDMWKKCLGTMFWSRLSAVRRTRKKLSGNITIRFTKQHGKQIFCQA